jgi:hypothetical protein
LPIDSADIVVQIRLYMSQPRTFTNAILEFSNLLCHSSMTDLSNYGTVAGQFWFHWPRFDNVVLYLSEGAGRIALADLDHFELRKNNRPAYCHQLVDVIRFFPLHLLDIVNEAHQFNGTVPNDITFVRDEALRYFKAVVDATAVLEFHTD